MYLFTAKHTCSIFWTVFEPYVKELMLDYQEGLIYSTTF